MADLHLHAKWNTHDAILLHLKVHSNGRLVVSLKYISTVPAVNSNNIIMTAIAL